MTQTETILKIHELQIEIIVMQKEIKRTKKHIELAGGALNYHWKILNDECRMNDFIIFCQTGKYPC